MPQRQVGLLSSPVNPQPLRQRSFGGLLGGGKRDELLGDHKARLSRSTWIAGGEKYQSGRNDGLRLAREAHRLATVGPEFDHGNTRNNVSRRAGGHRPIGTRPDSVAQTLQN